MNEKNNGILRVYRSRAQAKESYDKLSRYYDWFAGIFEKKYTNRFSCFPISPAMVKTDCIWPTAMTDINGKH